MKLNISISTCPNDTFMFDAMLHSRVDSGGLEFDLEMKDIECLNSDISELNADISKISYAAYPLIAKDYMILRSGSAIGYGNGPLLVSRHKIYPDEIPSLRIAIPGVHTTANRLLKMAFGEILEIREYLFSDISEAILDGEVDAGVLIHEERFSYKNKGLKLCADLGQEWEKIFSLPVPLGAIVVKRSLGNAIHKQIDALLRSSIEYAFENPMASYNFVKQHAKELSDEVLDKHIKMFVNNLSLDISDEGEAAVKKLLELETTENIFVNG